MALELKERKKAMLLGSFLGDVFVLGAHWIYNVKVIEARFGQYDAPHEPLPGGWHSGKHLGDYTHYGDQALLLYDYLKEWQGRYTDDGFRTVWRRYMNSYNGYMDIASKGSLEAFEKGGLIGSQSDELGGAARIAPVLYWVEDPAKALEAAVSQSRLTHNSEASLLATELFARMTLRTLEGAEQAVPDVLRASLDDMRQAGQNTALLDGYLEAAEAAAGKSAADIAAALGQSCHAHHAIPVIFALLLTSSDYRTVLSLNACIGGDSATRGMITGAILGARNGIDNLPADWLAVVKRLPELD
jgi:ADP-ribosylglycohydrolase